MSEIENIPEAIVASPRPHPVVRPKARKRKPEKKIKSPKDAKPQAGPQISDFLLPPTSAPGDIIDALMAAGDHSKPLLSGSENLKKLPVPGKLGKKVQAPKHPKAKAQPRPGGTFSQFETAMAVEAMPVKRDRPPPSFRSNR